MHSCPNTDVLATIAAKTIKPRIHFLLFWAVRRSNNMVRDRLHLEARARLAVTHGPSARGRLRPPGWLASCSTLRGGEGMVGAKPTFVFGALPLQKRS
jgi:hypothetical protein